VGFRFRRSFRLLPGVRLNVSKSGLSASLGRRGAWLTFGPKGTRATVGIPGTGLSYTEQSPWVRPTPHSDPGDSGIDVAELPHDEIEVPPVGEQQAQPIRLALVRDVDMVDPLLLPIALAIAGVVAVAALLWAALV
jgi:hypothetical protein